MEAGAVAAQRPVVLLPAAVAEAYPVAYLVVSYSAEYPAALEGPALAAHQVESWAASSPSEGAGESRAAWASRPVVDAVTCPGLALRPGASYLCEVTSPVEGAAFPGEEKVYPRAVAGTRASGTRQAACQVNPPAAFPAGPEGIPEVALEVSLQAEGSLQAMPC